MKKLHSKILNYRKLKGMTRLELCKRVECSYASMIRYEKAEQVPPIKVLLRLCALFYCQPGDLFFSTNVCQYDI